MTDTTAIAQAIKSADRRALARAITLAESTRADHRAAAADLLARLASSELSSIRIGISGTPGVGKSTFIEAFGTYLTGLGHRVAVLAVDPSSQRGGGSILGDKTRMADLSRDPNAYIRPSPAGRTLGGVARRTREAITLVEAAGFDVVIVETVGVGQSEAAVADMVDLFVLLVGPGGGDDLQGIKRGIMELADLVVINKADGDLLRQAKVTQSDYHAALGLMRVRDPAWAPRVMLASALTKQGIDDIWAAIGAFRQAVTTDGIARHRQAQAQNWLWREVGDLLLDQVRDHPGVATLLPRVEADVGAGRLTATAGAELVIQTFLGSAG